MSRALPPQTMETLKKILFVAGFAVLFVGVASLFWMNHVDFKNAMIRQTQEELSIISRSQAQSIERYLVGIRRELEILSTAPSIHGILKEEYRESNKPEYYQYLGKAYHDVEELVDSVYLINARGVVVNVSPFDSNVVGRDLSGRSDVALMLSGREAFTSDLLKTSSGNWAVASLYPVFEGDAFIGLIRAVVLIDRINALANAAHLETNVYVIVINDHGTLLSYPDKDYVGRDVGDLLTGRLPGPDVSEFDALVKKMKAGEAGESELPFLSGGRGPDVVATLAAYAPLYVSNNRWSIVAAMDYSVLSGMINKNTRDNLILMGTFIAIFLIMMNVLYRNRKKMEELEISSTASRIINKLLRSEVDDGRRRQKQAEHLFNHRKTGR